MQDAWSLGRLGLFDASRAMDIDKYFEDSQNVTGMLNFDIAAQVGSITVVLMPYVRRTQTSSQTCK